MQLYKVLKVSGLSSRDHLKKKVSNIIKMLAVLTAKHISYKIINGIVP